MKYNLNLDEFATFEITFGGKTYVLEAPSIDNALEFDKLFVNFVSRHKLDKNGKEIMQEVKDEKTGEIVEKPVEKTSAEALKAMTDIVVRLFIDKEEAKAAMKVMNMVQMNNLIKYANDLFNGRVDESLKQSEK